jgi:hypothetical protein
MLQRDLPETITVQGETLEVWVRAPRARRARQKVERRTATAFLVASNDGTFLVTAGHVAHAICGNATVSFAGRRGRQRSLPLSELLPAGRRAVRWFVDERTDVAALRIRLLPELRDRFLPATRLATRMMAPLGTAELLIVGFPLGLANERCFSPIGKRAHAASGIVRLCGEDMPRPSDFFLLDQPAAKGLSGAPVFEIDARNGRAPLMVGLVSQTICDDSIGQFAAVVPALRVRALLVRIRRSRGAPARAGAPTRPKATAQARHRRDPERT